LRETHTNEESLNSIIASIQIESRLKKEADEIGALKEITPNVVLSSLKYVKKGKVESLGQTFSTDMPTVWFHGPFFYSTFRNATTCLNMFKRDFDNKLGSTVCRYEFSDHTGTHVDSLNHAAEGYELYGGVDVRKISTDHGTTRLGIDTMPAVFTRGVLLDFPSFFGIDILEPSFEITPKHIESLARKQKISFGPGDAVLFYTGYSKLWAKDNQRYLSDNPGPGLLAAKWLVKHRVGITGADTSSYEVVKRKTRKLFPCHQILIKQNGIHLVENLKLDTLAKEGLKEFLFILSPLKFKGGAGSPVSPMAVY
jgi:kynurenine formamidase